MKAPGLTTNMGLDYLKKKSRYPAQVEEVAFVTTWADVCAIRVAGDIGGFGQQ